MPAKPVSIKLSTAQIEALDASARRESARTGRRITRGDLIRLAIAAYLGDAWPADDIESWGDPERLPHIKGRRV